MNMLTLGAAFLFSAAALCAAAARAHTGDREHDHAHADGHARRGQPGRHQPMGAEAGEPHDHAHPGVDLSHPIVTESPLPETAVKLRYNYADAGGGESEHTVTAEVEYAFTQTIGVEAVVPYTFLDSDNGDSTDRLGDVEVAFKLATYEFLDRNLLPSVGIAVGLPTGDEEDGIGSDHVVELEPFVRVGHWRGRFEFIGTVDVGIPLNRKGEERDEEDFAVGYNLSVLYHVTQDLQALVELHGESVFGDADDTHAFYVSPGFTVHPFPDKSIVVGAGVSLPLTGEDDREFDYAVNVLTIFHL